MMHAIKKTYSDIKSLAHFSLYIALVFMTTGMVQANERTAFVHLFEWSWQDVAQECEDFLGPKGFAAVQVSPPQEHISGSAWWTRYQPTGYNINSRSGDRQQFQSMVNRCKAVGVDIYVDAVINHMAAGSRNFPSVPYSESNFHQCFTDIDYRNRESIQTCGLSGLNDLVTGSDYVQGKISDYLNDLLSMNVAGFRIDAAKHIASNELGGILSRVNGSPYIFSEVIGAEGEPVKTTEYTGLGNVTEFQFERSMAYFFRDGGQIKDLQGLKDWNNWLESDQAVIFVANHDDQRQHPEYTLTHKDGDDVYFLANIFMLAYPYGYPKVMSSYHFNDHDQGPPSSGPHTGNSCDSGWVCEHRWRGIANMVGFRNAAANDWTINNWWDNGGNQIAFGRGDAAFVIINRDPSSLSRSFQTGMPPGEYCEIIRGEYSSGQCAGNSIIVNNDGTAAFDVRGTDAAAIHINARICTGDNCESNEPTGPINPEVGESTWANAYFRGTPNSWTTTPMTFEQGEWITTQTFAADGAFKISRFENWTEAYPEENMLINSGEGNYRIAFNDVTKNISITKISDDPTIPEQPPEEPATPEEPEQPTTPVNWDSAYLRGTPNDWSTTPMTLVNGKWTIEQTFGEGDGFGPARFKISRFEDWTEAYPQQDFSIDEGAGTYLITFDDTSKVITASKVTTSEPEPTEPQPEPPTNPSEPEVPVEPTPPAQASWDTAYFVGSSNDWTLTPMQDVDGLWIVRQTFAAESGVTHYFRITNNTDYQLIAPANSFVNVPEPGTYLIVFDPQNMTIDTTLITPTAPPANNPGEEQEPEDGESGTINDPLPAGAMHFYLLLLGLLTFAVRRKTT